MSYRHWAGTDHILDQSQRHEWLVYPLNTFIRCTTENSKRSIIIEILTQNYFRYKILDSACFRDERNAGLSLAPNATRRTSMQSAFGRYCCLGGRGEHNSRASAEQSRASAKCPIPRHTNQWGIRVRVFRPLRTAAAWQRSSPSAAIKIWVESKERSYMTPCLPCSVEVRS
jgi:hypothetical protein